MSGSAGYAIGDVVGCRRYHRAERELGVQLDCDALPAELRRAASLARRVAREALDLAERIEAKAAREAA